MKTIYLSSFFALILFLCSCESLDKPLMDRESDLTYWDKPEDALYALNSCYPDLYGAEAYVFLESLSDNAYTRGNEGSLVRNVANGSYDASSDYVRNVWKARFEGIKRCNILLDNINKVPGLNNDLKQRYIAEAKAIRAFHNFILMNNFGDIPLVKNEISIADSKTIGRTPKAEVLQFILDELDFAIANLPNSYPDTDKGRFTKGAAMALKARVLLCESRWKEVADICDAIINKKEAGNIQLFNNYAGLFKIENKNNIEVMLNVEFMSIKREHINQYYLVPPTMGGYASVSPTQELVDDYILLNGKTTSDPSYNEATPYANRDPRLSATIIYDGSTMEKSDGTSVTILTAPGTSENAIGYSSNSTSTGYYVAKYYDKNARSMINSGYNLILIRYADVLLMYAEAKNNLNEFAQSEWNLTIKTLRTRAGFTDANALEYPSVNQAQMNDIIHRERRSELAMEGLRIMDLKRWKTAETALNGWFHGMKTDEAPLIDRGYVRIDKRMFDKNKNYLWPIPQSERDLNKNLTQNPNW